MSDVFAMGGKPLLALNIVCFPVDRLNDLNEIIRGGLEKVQEAGAILVGGHSLKDKEPKYGLAVLGIIHPDRIIRNHTPQVGDALILTKPLGTGIISTALKEERITVQEVQKAIDSMMQLNHIPEHITNGSIHSMTDITGFGFLGHLSEMLAGGDLVADIQANHVPILDKAYSLSRQNIFPGGSISNKNNFSCSVEKQRELNPAEEMLLYDAQTSGGLLIAIGEQDVEHTLILLMEQGFTASQVVGRIRKRSANEKKIYLV